jgi:hypothetical protein
LEALRYYAAIQPGLGRRFYDEVEKLIGEACASPQQFRLIRPRVRRHLSKIFPYGLLFVERPDGIFILAVMHCSRRPDYWAHRQV